MSEEQPTRRERLSKALKMNQQPKDRLWGVIYALIVLVISVGLITVVYSRSIQSSVARETVEGFERGSVYCMTIIGNPDRTFRLPSYCNKPEVIVHYPPEVCEELFQRFDLCSRDWEEG
jgi:hypothetical protein